MTQDKKEMVARPRVIAHMMTSVDGRIVTEAWPLSEEERREYEQIHATYGANGWLCGRTTMELHFAAEGGGAINGSFLRDDLVDEVSLLLLSRAGSDFEWRLTAM